MGGFSILLKCLSATWKHGNIGSNLGSIYIDTHLSVIYMYVYEYVNSMDHIMKVIMGNDTT